MQYRKMKDSTEVSILGYGCMRFTGAGTRINLEKTEKEIMLAVKNGVNYFDTAYIYPGSEEALGTILERNHCRDQVYIADKLPYYLLKNTAAAEKLFQEQLRRLKTDHIDFYLMHMLFDTGVWARLQSIGIEEWIAEKKETGAIRNIGFPSTVIQILSRRWSTLTTGISARFSTIIWTNIHRQDEKGCTMPPAKAFPWSSWNPYGVASSSTLCPTAPKKLLRSIP